MNILVKYQSGKLVVPFTRYLTFPFEIIVVNTFSAVCNGYRGSIEQYVHRANIRTLDSDIRPPEIRS
jgi:hypothetical protein